MPGRGDRPHDPHPGISSILPSLTAPVAGAIDELEGWSKHGESYADASGRYGWRNPIRRDTGPLLHALVRARHPSRILEIGTAHGLSGLYLASALDPDSTAVMDTVELDPEVAEEAQRRFQRCGVPVRVHAGDALEVIARFDGPPFEVVFLDAQKDHYRRQTEALEGRGLLAPGALLLADNVLDRREECRPLLEWLTERRIPYGILPTECGLLVARL